MAGGCALWLLAPRPPFSRYVVDGPSMEPAYRAGDRLLIARWASARRPPAPGEVVVVRDPGQPSRLLLKRVAAVDGAGRCFVVGDNPPASRDSRHFGSVDRDAIVGRVWRRY